MNRLQMLLVGIFIVVAFLVYYKFVLVFNEKPGLAIGGSFVVTCFLVGTLYFVGNKI